MRRSVLLLSAVSALLAGCGRKQAAPATASTPTPAGTARVAAVSPSATPAAAANEKKEPFAAAAERVRRAVVVLTVFDQTGHVAGNGHGFFVSDDGKLVADRSVLASAVNAVAKSAEGAIYNVAGALAYSPTQNFALLKAQAQRVPSLAASASALPETGGKIAAVLGPVGKSERAFLEETIGGRFRDPAGEWFDVTPPLPRQSAGAPVINENGEVIGIVGFRAENNTCVIRPASVANTLLAQVSSNMIANWQSPKVAAATSPITTPGKSATPAKIPLHGSKLVYAPAPHYPGALERERTAARSSGSYRIRFDPQGRAESVQIVHSTGNLQLDQAAVSALRTWRSEPGRNWTLVVPITFQP